jgi:hypothetical protein
MAIGDGGSADSCLQQTASVETTTQLEQQGQQQQESEQQEAEDAVAGCTGELLSRNAVFGPGCLVAAQDFFLRYECTHMGCWGVRECIHYRLAHCSGWQGMWRLTYVL